MPLIRITFLALLLALAGCGQDDGASATAPVLDPIGDQSVLQGSGTLNFTVTASDPNVLPLSFSWDPAIGPHANPQSDGATFNTGNGQFSWNYTGVAAGDYSAKFTVTNSNGESDSEIITISVSDGSPILASIGNKSITEGGSTLIINLSANDPQSLNLTYSIDGSVGPGLNPENYGATISSNQFSWDYTGNTAPTGDYSIKFTVTNSNGLSDSETITITLASAAAVNGQALYEAHCASCHGYGTASTKKSSLYVDIYDAIFTPGLKISEMQRSDLLALTSAEITAIVEYLHSIPVN